MIRFLSLCSLLLASIAYAAPSIEILAELNQRPGNPEVGPDDSIVATINPLNRAALFNRGLDDSEPPYYLVRIS